jgi:hypothetical protein
MEASITLWKKWQEQVKELLPEVHGHQKKSLALSVIGIVLSKSAVLQRMAESLYLQGISSAKMPRYSPALGPVCGQFAHPGQQHLEAVSAADLAVLERQTGPVGVRLYAHRFASDHRVRRLDFRIRGSYLWLGGSCPTSRNGSKASGSS